MKLILNLFTIFTFNFCIAQTSTLSDNFLAGLTDKYTQQDLNKYTQYYRLLLPLKNLSAYNRTIECKAKAVHSTKKSRFVERNQTIGFYAFEYPSKKVCLQALDSLLKCFPNHCLKIENGKPFTNDKITPSVFIINGKTIYGIEIYCEDENEQWEAVQKTFVDTFADKSSTILHSECGKLAWTTKENFKK